MENETKVTMKNFLGGQPTLADSLAEAPVDSTEEEVGTSIAVEYVDEEAIDLPEIRDTYGRLSDAIEALERITGLSVVPLEMAHIAPEVISLQRHEIFSFGGKRYAMSKKPREITLKTMQDEIVTSLTTGLPYECVLNTTVQYDGQYYSTLSLSRVEWTLLMSRFRHYKQNLSFKNNGTLVLEMFAERVD